MIKFAIRIAQAIVSRNAWVLLAASYPMIGLIGSCAGRSAVEHKLRFEREVYAENLAAVQDTSRRLRLQVGVLGDSLAVTQRRAVQQQQRGDALDRALGLQRRARIAATLELPRVTAAVGGEVGAAPDSTASHDDVRRARFVLDEAWYSGSADVVLPRLPGQAQLSLDLAMRPIPLELRLGCSARNGSGVGGASASVTAPRWARLTLTNVEQDAGVCSRMNATASTRRSLTTVLRERLAVVVGYGAMSGLWKPVLAVGLRLW